MHVNGNGQTVTQRRVRASPPAGLTRQDGACGSAPGSGTHRAPSKGARPGAAGSCEMQTPGMSGSPGDIRPSVRSVLCGPPGEPGGMQVIGRVCRDAQRGSAVTGWDARRLGRPSAPGRGRSPRPGGLGASPALTMASVAAPGKGPRRLTPTPANRSSGNSAWPPDGRRAATAPRPPTASGWEHSKLLPSSPRPALSGVTWGDGTPPTSFLKAHFLFG